MQATQDDLSSLSSISAFMVHNEIRKQISLFGEIDAELDFTEYLIRSEIYKADEARFRSKKRTKELSADLVRALRTLSIEQLIRHYNVMVEQVSQLRRDVVSAPSLPSSSFLIVQAFAKSYTLKIWKRKKLRFDRENHIIYAEKDKKIKIYDLGNYLVRKSTTSDYVCLVLEATNDLPLPKNKTVHFGFEFKNAYNLWIHSIEASVIYKQWQRIATLLHKDSQLLQPTIKLP